MRPDSPRTEILFDPVIERRRQMKTKPGKKPATRKATPSRSAAKKSTVKKTVGKTRSAPGFFSRASHMVGEVLLGAATGAVAGAMEGVVEAGGKEMGIPKKSGAKVSSPKCKAEQPGNAKPKKRK
jgi:hypothetical protein